MWMWKWLYLFQANVARGYYLVEWLGWSVWFGWLH